MRKITLIAAMLAIFGATELTAQATATATITIPQLLHVDIDVTSVPFPTPLLGDWETGSVAASASTVVSTRSNVGHQVLIAADEEFMFVGGATSTKPAGHLEWSTDGGSTFAALSTGAVTILPGLARGVNAAAGTVSYRMRLSEATDDPGTYSLGFTFTVLPN